MGMTVNQWPPTQKEVDLRMDLINEEFNELAGEVYDQSLESMGMDVEPFMDYLKTAKELADILYVVYGTAVSFGIDIDKVFAEVHKSNMSKLEDGKPVLREDGKVLKGKNYAPPNLEQLEFTFK